MNELIHISDEAREWASKYYNRYSYSIQLTRAQMPSLEMLFQLAINSAIKRTAHNADEMLEKKDKEREQEMLRLKLVEHVLDDEYKPNQGVASTEQCPTLQSAIRVINERNQLRQQLEELKQKTKALIEYELGTFEMKCAFEKTQHLPSCASAGSVYDNWCWPCKHRRMLEQHLEVLK